MKNALKEHNYALDFIKITACIAIVLHHYQNMSGASFPCCNFSNGSFYVGLLVEMFFMLSGFFMWKYIDKDLSFSDFFIPRYVRLFPVNLLGAFLHSVYVYCIFKSCHLWGLIISALGLNALGGLDLSPFVYNINAPSWYISVLLLCYVIFYLLSWLHRNKNISMKWLCVGMILLGLLIKSYGVDLPLLNSYTSRGYCAFFMGVLISLLLNKIKLKPVHYFISGITAIIFLFLLVFRMDLITFNGSLDKNLTFIFYPVIIVIFQCPLIKKIFNHRCLGTIGGISFSVYLLHVPIYSFMTLIGPKLGITLPLASYKFMLAFVFGCFILCTPVYFFYEKRCSKWFLNKYRKYKELSVNN